MLLVVYYSRSGKTAALATCLAEKLSADCRRIDDVKPRRGIWGFIRSGFESSSGRLARIKPIEPALSAEQLAGFDGVILLGPVWAGTISSPLRTFCCQYREGITRYALILTCGDQISQWEKGRAAVRQIIGRPADFQRTLSSTGLDVEQQAAALSREIQVAFGIS
jgi:menaquinone-dependent protoporphyrinogen IX oxidase